MTTHPGPADPAEIKSCCAAAYGGDAVALVLGESYHPGGRALTERLAEALDLRAGERVADVAAGRGATANLLATEHGVDVDGTELNPDTVRTARAGAEQAGLAGWVRFHVGDAERIPLPDGRFDAITCECAFCTFPDKHSAATEFARLLRPGGRVGLTDVTVHPGGLPSELASLTGWIACLADARPLEQYTAILAEAGLRTTHTEPHDDALRSMIDTIEARLKLLRMTAADQLEAAGVDVEAVLDHTRRAAGAAANGTLGYALLIAEKPA